MEGGRGSGDDKDGAVELAEVSGPSTGGIQVGAAGGGVHISVGGPYP